LFRILSKEYLNAEVVRMDIEAPAVAKRAMPGQFIILRVDDAGERIPLTIAHYDRVLGTVTIIFQTVGFTTGLLAKKNTGEFISDFVGPLGRASELENIKRAAVIGGGLGTAIAWPQAKALHEAGAKVDVITGFRNKDLILLSKELEACCDRLIEMTDDGSNGNKGFVTNALQKLIDSGNQYDAVIAIGPLPMMKFVSMLTKPYGIRTIVSMNPIMIDGTGMCGCCRVTVGGKMRFACVDGPDFDGHQVDFDEAIRRCNMFRPQQEEARHACRLMEKEVEGE